MKNIYQYIVEKLKINKDTKIKRQHTFNNGDKILCISLQHFIKENHCRIYCLTCISFKNNNLTYKTDKGKTLTKCVFLNSNNFYEHHTDEVTAIFMNKYDALEILSEINLKFSDNYLYKNYYDKEDEFIFDNKLVKTFTEERINYIKNELEKNETN